MIAVADGHRDISAAHWLRSRGVSIFQRTVSLAFCMSNMILTCVLLLGVTFVDTT